MKKILILNGEYIPGFKGGGPIRSIKNLVDNLGERYKFDILTGDRDFNEKSPYEGIKLNEWIEKGNNVRVYYMAKKNQRFIYFKKIFNEGNYDGIYMNGYFSPIFTIKPLLLKKLGLIKANILLCPRGDFSPGALKTRKIKKYIYILGAKFIGLYSTVKWHATSGIENDDIKKIYKDANIYVAPNLSSKIEEDNCKINYEKKAGIIKLVFISRIVPKKNLKYAVELLNKYSFDGKIIFDIYGPIEDKIYWKQIEENIDVSNKDIQIRYKGQLQHSEINEKLKQYDALFFPTLGENFGHIIIEALMSGCFVMTSDQTPWNDLSDFNAGISVNLRNEEAFVTSINRIIRMQSDDIRVLKNNSIRYSIMKTSDRRNIDANIKMFELL